MSFWRKVIISCSCLIVFHLVGNYLSQTILTDPGPVFTMNKPLYHKISLSPSAMIILLQNLTVTSAALLLRCLSNLRAILWLWRPISCLPWYRKSTIWQLILQLSWACPLPHPLSSSKASTGGKPAPNGIRLFMQKILIPPEFANHHLSMSQMNCRKCWLFHSSNYISMG